VARPAAPPRPVAARALQVHNTYLVAPYEDGLLVIDQHALHERILYNELRRRLDAGRLQAQRLLIPETVSVGPTEAELLAERTDLLERLGMEVSRFGPGTVAVQRFPSLLIERGVGPGAFLRAALDALGEDETTDPERLLSKLLALMACKAAVKAGDPLTAEEMDALLAAREGAEKGSACPHGRPTTLRLTLKDLQKQFHRT